MYKDLLQHPALSMQQQILLNTDGTVTDLIALLAGESIHITKVEQGLIVDRGPAALELSEERNLLKRTVLLSGQQKHYLYAESYFVLEQMPPAMQVQLLETDIPIGLLWKQARLEMYREVIEQKVESCPELVTHFRGMEGETFLSRSYVVHHGGRPLGLITEKFPGSYFANPLEQSRDD